VIENPRDRLRKTMKRKKKKGKFYVSIRLETLRVMIELLGHLGV
jgi:hypothetical protein